MKSIDGNNECRKKCFRTVKAICKGESTLRALPSFYLKMILFHADDQYPLMSWEPEDFCVRFFQFLGFIEQYLEEETLPHYFNRAMNIFVLLVLATSTLKICLIALETYELKKKSL